MRTRPVPIIGIFTLGLLGIFVSCTELPFFSRNANERTDPLPPRRINGPGAPGIRKDIVSNANRVHGPSMLGKGTTIQRSAIAQGLSADGGRVNVDFSGVTPGFSEVYFGLGDLWRDVDYVDDAGVYHHEADVVVPAALYRVRPDGTSEAIYTFMDTAAEHARFDAVNNGFIEYGGEELRISRNLVVPTTLDDLGNIYLASNASPEILKFSPSDTGYERSVFAVLTSNVGDIRFANGRFLVTTLPKFKLDPETLLLPPQVLSLDREGQLLEVIASLPGDVSSYLGLAATYYVSLGDGGVEQISIGTGVVFKLVELPLGDILVTSSYQGTIYRIAPDRTISAFSTGLRGISSISTSPVTDWLYATLPATILDHSAENAEPSYGSLPKIVSISPIGETNTFLEMTEYQTINPRVALNGTAYPLPNQPGWIASTEMHTIAADSNGNLILADPVRNAIVAINVLPAATDAGMIDIDGSLSSDLDGGNALLDPDAGSATADLDAGEGDGPVP